MPKRAIEFRAKWAVAWVAASVCACAGHHDRADEAPTASDDAAVEVPASSDDAATAAPTFGDSSVAPDPEPLCDGRDDVRLGVQTDRAEGHDSFAEPHGISFLFIDGKCRYHASTNFMKGVASGTLSAAEADEVAAELGWSMLDVWTASSASLTVPHGGAFCFDGGSISIAKVGHEIRCSCKCPDEADPGSAAEALRGAYDWIAELEERGTPLAGPVRAKADLGIPAGRGLPWPLARAIESIPGLTGDDDAGARFADPTETMQLRELRAAAFAANPLLGVSDVSFAVLDDGVTYYLKARDELPDGLGIMNLGP